MPAFVQVTGVRFFVTECVTRIPFRFGITTLERCPLCLLEAEVADGSGARARGYSSDLLVPKWFEKDPAKSAEEDSAALRDSARRAARSAIGEAPPQGETVFELWWRVYGRRVESRPPDAGDRLVRGFGVALLERALLDAVSRSAGQSFFEALGHDLYGFRPGAVRAELEDWDLAAALGPRSSSVQVRHTVGLADALREEEVPDSDRRADDHPLCLEADVERYGLDCFKVKVNGDPGGDLDRLLRIESVLRERCANEYRLTLDGNEQFRSIDDLRRLFRELESRPAGQRLLERLLYVEQPLPRSTSLDPSAVGPEDLRPLDPFGGVILDEADSGLEAFPRAIELGYRGISVKNCKGVFRAFSNRGLCELRSTPERPLFQSSEDLTNLPVWALQQDLATLSALGLEHSERNGHHYFRGLDHLSAIEVAGAIERHGGSGGLYLREPSPRLRIEDGRLDLDSLDRPGYGSDLEPDLDEATTVWREAWQERGVLRHE